MRGIYVRTCESIGGSRAYVHVGVYDAYVIVDLSLSLRVSGSPRRCASSLRIAVRAFRWYRNGNYPADPSVLVRQFLRRPGGMVATPTNIGSAHYSDLLPTYLPPPFIAVVDVWPPAWLYLDIFHVVIDKLYSLKMFQYIRSVNFNF